MTDKAKNISNFYTTTPNSWYSKEARITEDTSSKQYSEISTDTKLRGISMAYESNLLPNTK